MRRNLFISWRLYQSKWMLLLFLSLLSGELLAQFSPSGQSRLTVPNILSACGRDTVVLEFTNKEGPTCTGGGGGPTATFLVTLPGGGTNISYEVGSISSLPTGVSAVSAGGLLTITAPVPSFGTSTRIKFVVNTTCAAAPSDTLPYFVVTANYPAGFTTPSETWNGAKMNTGLPQLNYWYGGYTNHIGGTGSATGGSTAYNNNTPWNGINSVVPFDESFGPYIRIENQGYGKIVELEYHVILDDSIYNEYYTKYGPMYNFWYTYSNNGVYDGSNSKGNHSNSGGTNIDATQTLTTTSNGKRHFILNIKGNGLGGTDNTLNGGDAINLYQYWRAAKTCISTQNITEWITYKCADGAVACARTDTLRNTISVSAGRPIYTSSAATSDAWDGCPNKSATITITNTGTPDLARPEFSTGYDSKLYLNTGTGALEITNLIINGVNVMPGPFTAGTQIDLAAFYTTDFDGAGVGLDDLDADGKIDDFAPGKALNIQYTWAVPCTGVCGPQLDFNMTTTGSFTDYCRKLNGVVNTPIYRFGFSQTAPIVQKTPIPNFGTMGGKALATRIDTFTWNYRQYNVDLTNANMQLRINYSRSMEVVEPIRFLGQNFTLADFTKEGNEVGAPYPGQVPGSTAGVYADTLNNTVDTDSVLVLNLTGAMMAKLFDNASDTLIYALTHISCGSFQNQGNSNSFQILFQFSNNICATTGLPPCKLDLACKKGFAYQINEGCGNKPCYIVNDQIFRKSALGFTDVNETTPLVTAPTNFYAGDTLVKRFTTHLSADYPYLEPIGTYLNVGECLNNYFSITYDKVPGAPIKLQPLIFIPGLSKVYVVDTTINDTIAVAPLELVDLLSYSPYGHQTGTQAYTPNAVPTVLDRAVDPSYWGGTLASHWCHYGDWPIDPASCPYGLERYYTPNGNSPYHFYMINAADNRVSESYYIGYERALARAGYSFSPGYGKYKFILDEVWRVNPDFPHTNTGQITFRGGTYHYGNTVYPVPGTYMGACGTAQALATVFTKELTVQDPGKTYNSSCGLTVENKLHLRSMTGDAFPGGEVRVAYKLDSITVDLPTEYELSGGNTYTYHQGGVVNTGTATPSAVTGHIRWTSTGVNGEFPRIDDLAGNNVVQSLVYAIDNSGTDNFILNSYRVPVVYYLKDEFGKAFTLVDTMNIVESLADLTLSTVGSIAPIADANGCSNVQYMDMLVANNSDYTAGFSMLNLVGTAQTQVLRVQDLGTVLDPIALGDTGTVSPNRKYALLGAVASAEQRVVRVYFQTTACKDSIKVISNFGCNYPPANNIYTYSTTLDSAYIHFEAVTPKIVMGSLTSNVNVARLCDTVTIEVEVVNAKDPNLTDVSAGFKLPPNMRYVPNSAQINAVHVGAITNPYYYINVPSGDVTSSGLAGDSVIVRADATIQHPSNLNSWGSMAYFYPGCGFVGPNDHLLYSEKRGVIPGSSAGGSYRGMNKIRIRIKAVFDACPVGTSSAVYTDARAESFCGAETKARVVTNILYQGATGTPNTYSCAVTPGSEVYVCAEPGQVQRITDDLRVSVLTGVATTGQDSLTITIGNDATKFTMSNFSASGFGAPVVRITPEGRTTLTFAVPAGIAAGSFFNLPLQYDMNVLQKDFCGDASSAPCADIAYSVSFFSTVSVNCAGFACASLGQVSRGVSTALRDLKCCARLGNYVWLDSDKDGVQDAGETPVAGVTVTLLDASGNVLATTTTDASGLYVFNNAPTGIPLTVKVSPPVGYTFTTADQGGDNATDSDVLNPSTGTMAAVTLTPGESNMTLDAGLIPTPQPTASLGDRVWFDSNNDGLQTPGEEGFAGVTVTLLDAAGNVVASTITDADGNYMFTDLVPGTYSVSITEPIGYALTTQNAGGAASNANNGTDLNDSDLSPTSHNSGSVTLATGENNLGLDAGLVKTAASTATVGDRVWYDIDKDGVQDVGEQGVAGVTVELLDASGSVIATTVTDALGNYIFNNVAASATGTDYSVRFSDLPAGYVASPKDNFTGDAIDSDANPATLTSDKFTVKPGDINLTLDLGINNPSSTGTASLGDKVWFDSNNDGIQDADELGVIGVTVTLYNSSGVAIATTMTDKNGNYLFTGLDAGTYSVGFSNLPEGYTFTTQESVASATGSDVGGDGRTATVTLTTGQQYLDLDAGIINTEQTQGTASLGNYVWNDLDQDGVQDAGEPGVAGVIVNLLDANGNPVDGDPNTPGVQAATMRTDANGYYQFNNLPAGNYIVEFLPSSLPATYVFTSQDAGAGTDATDSDANTSTGRTGIISLSLGEHNNTVDAGIHNPAAVGTLGSLGDKVWFDTNNNGQQDETNGPSGGVAGVPGVMVTLYNAGTGAVIATTVTDANGNYLFPDLPAGNYQVGFTNLPSGFVFSPANSGADASDSDVFPNESRTGTIALAAGENNLTVDAGINNVNTASLGNYVWYDANMDGIQDASETGVAGVTVTLYNSSNQPVSTAITDASGFYFFPNLTPGTYSVGYSTLPDNFVFTDDNAVGSTDANDSDVDATTGRETGIVLSAGQVDLTHDAGIHPAKPTGALTGYAWQDYDGSAPNNNGQQDAGEMPLAGVTVNLYKGGILVGTTVTDASGVYTFTNLVPGNDYTVEMIPPAGTTVTGLNVGSDLTDSDLTSTAGTTPGSFTTSGGPFTVNAGKVTDGPDAGIIKETASLGNYVWLDANKDGVQDGTEKGVSGVTVTLFDANTNQVIATTQTDANGMYLFPDLAPGDYRIKVTLPTDYVFTTTGANGSDDPSDSDINAVSGLSDVYTLSAGENNMTVDAGIYYPIPATANLGNYVWMDTDGDGVQDSNEVGVAGVTVTLYDNGGNPIATTVTGFDGGYMFTNLAPGTYSVGFSTPTGYVFTGADAGGNDAADSDANTSTGRTSTVTLVAGETNTTLDAGLVPQSTALGSIGNLVWYDVDQDGIQDLGEPGIPGVTVQLIDANTLAVLATTVTDGLGNYLFSNLPAGAYQVQITAPSGMTFSVANVGQPTGPYDGDIGEDSDAETVVGNQATTSVINLMTGQNMPIYDFGLYPSSPAGTLELGDKVWYDVNNDGVQDAGENGVAGVTVTLYAADGTTVLATTTTDANGNYLFPNLAAASYVVGFSNLPLGYAFTDAGQGSAATGSDANPASGKTALINLSADNYDVDAGIIMNNVEGVAGGKGSIGNFVWNDLDNDGVQDAGEPGIGGVVVTLNKDLNGDGDFSDPGETGFATTVTDASGAYTFNNLDAGNYVVTVATPSGFTASPANAGGNDATDSDFTSGSSPVVSLAQGETNNTIDAGFHSTSGNTASLGNYVWLDADNDGVQDAGENGVEGVAVTLYDATTGAVLATTVTDVNGLYLFPNLAAGSYQVGFSNIPSGMIFTTRESSTGTAATNSDANADGRTGTIVLNAGEQNLTVDAGIRSNKASVGDYVWMDLDKDGVQDVGEPGVAGVTVTLYDNSGNVVASAITDANGAYNFPNVDPGTYTIGFSTLPDGTKFTAQDATADNADSDANPTTGQTASFTVNPGDVITTLDAGLITPNNTSLYGYAWRDYDGDGQQPTGLQGNDWAVSGVTVTIVNTVTGQTFTTVTGVDGSYHFDGIPAGTYTTSFSTHPVGADVTLANVGNDNTDNDMTSLSATFVVTVPDNSHIHGADIGYTPTGTLPVVLLGFEGTWSGEDALLSWSTSSELNSSHFVLERSFDRVNFSAINTTEAAHNSTTVRNYQATDKNVGLLDKARIYYRLAMVDLDGAMLNSKVVEFRDYTKNTLVSVYPNPSSDVVNISFVRDAQTEPSLTITNAIGQVVYTQALSGNVGETENISLPVKDWSKGVYLIRIGDDKSDKVNKFIVE